MRLSLERRSTRRAGLRYWVGMLFIAAGIGRNTTIAADHSVGPGSPTRVGKPIFVLQTGHSSSWLAVAFSPDSRILASGDHAGMIKLWDTATGRLRATVQGQAPGVHALAFSPNGALLASAGADGTVQLWNAATGELHGALQTGRMDVWSIAFSPDGGLLASASSDTNVVLWDVARGSRHATLKGHRGWVKGVSFLPDGKTLVSGALDGTIIFWDVASATKRAIVAAGDILSLAVSSDGQWLASGDRDGTVKLWDPATATMRFTLGRDSGFVDSLAFSRDGSTLAATVGRIRVWNTATRKERNVGELRAGSGWEFDSHGVTFSPDGKQMALGSGQSVVLRTSTFALLRTFPAHTEPTWAVAVSPNGATLASVSLYANSISLWDIASGRIRLTLKGQDSLRTVTRVAWSPHSDMLASGESVTGRVMLWKAATGALRRTLNAHLWDVTDLAFSADGKLLVTGCEKDKVSKVWDAVTGAPRALIPSAGKIAISPDGKVLALAEGYGELWLSDPSGKHRHDTLDKNISVDQMAFSPDGTLLAVYGLSSSIQIWNVQRRERVAKLEDSSIVLGFTFNPNGKTLVATYHDGSLVTWETATGARHSVVKESAGHGVSFGPGGRVLAVAGNGGVVLRRMSDGASVTLVSFEQVSGPRILVHSPNGLFTGDDETFDRVVFRVGNDLRSADLLTAGQLFDYFHRPQLMEDFLAGRPLDPLPEVREGVGRPPAVSMLEAPSGTTSVRAARVRVRAQDRGGGVSEVRLFVNGARVSSERAVGANGAEREFDVLLSSGENVIRAEAYSDIGRVRGVSVEQRVVLRSDDALQPDLHLFAMTIGQYEDGAILDYPVRDGRAVVGAFERQKGRLFREVRPEVLVDRDATREAAESALDRIAEKATPEDVFVFYAAGHGGLVRCDGEKEPAYRLLTYRAGLGSDQSLCTEALSLARLTKKLRAIRAKKKLLVLDTCASGAASTGETLLAIRGGEEVDAIKRLARSEGLAIVSAATDRAFEVRSLEHGLFTYTLLRGLGGGASIGAEHVVSVFALLGYIDREMPGLSEKYLHREQRPIYSTQGQDFPLFMLRDSDGPLVTSSTDVLASEPLPDDVEARIRQHIESGRRLVLACSERDALAVRATLGRDGGVAFTLERRDGTLEESRCVSAALPRLTLRRGRSGTLVHALARD